jgi:superfamily II DNA helicase RecQ
MAELMPSSLQEFSALRGVGEWKIEKYGDGFLNVLKQA